MGIEDACQPFANRCKCLIPGDLGELPTAFRSGAAHRVQYSIGVVHAIEELVDFRAQFTGGERVILIAAHSDGNTLRIGIDDPSTRVGAVVMTDAVAVADLSR